jgi:multidrug resistance protein, MATE family
MTQPSVQPELRLDDPCRWWGLGEVLRLSWPAGLSMLNGTVMMFVDGMMVARVGPEALAAQFVGGICSFIPVGFALGLLGLVNTYVSQNLGAGRLDRCGPYARAGIALAVIYTLLVQLLHIPAGWAFGLFGHEPLVYQYELLYFRYMLAGMGLMLIGRVLDQVFFAIDRPLVVLAASFAGNGVNVVANYALIFGKWHLPALGLEGAAIGTLLGAATMMVVLLAIFLARTMNARYATRRWRDVHAGQIRQIFRVGWPAGVQFASDVFSWSMLTAGLVGMFGTVHLAANTAVLRYVSLSFMPAAGMGVATTALVGRYIGAGRDDLARRRAHVALVISIIWMGLCGIIFILFAEELLSFYVRFEPAAGQEQAHATLQQIVAIGKRLLLVAALFQLFDAMQITYTSALRGAGDTLWPMILTIGLSWTVQLGSAVALITFAPQLESLGPWLAGCVFLAVLGVLLAWRFESGKWRTIDLLAQPAEPLVPIDVPLEK